MATTKQEVFVEVCQGNFGTFMDELVEKIEALGGGFTDAQKLSLLTEIITKRTTHGRNIEAFYLDFSPIKQNALLSIVDDILADREIAAQARLDEITALRAILAT